MKLTQLSPLYRSSSQFHSSPITRTRYLLRCTLRVSVRVAAQLSTQKSDRRRQTKNTRHEGQDEMQRDRPAALT